MIISSLIGSHDAHVEPQGAEQTVDSLHLDQDL